MFLGIIFPFCQQGDVFAQAAANQAAQPRNVEPAKVRMQFIDVERVAQMGVWQQKSHLSRLYYILLPDLTRNYVGGLALPIPPIDRRGSPEVVADRILANEFGGPAHLNNDALDLCREILRGHPKEVAGYIRADLKKSHQALLLVSDFRFPDLFQDVERYLRNSDVVIAEEAAVALERMNDARAIGPIIQRFPDLKFSNPIILVFTNPLQSLQKGRKAHPRLIRLARSADSELKARAVEALLCSGDEALGPLIKELRNDPDKKIRDMAQTMNRYVLGELPAQPQRVQVIQGFEK